MRLVVVCLRRFSMVVCALGTIGLGIVLVWALIRPGVIQSVGTAELAGVAGALLAPCLALFALRLDSRIARRDHLEVLIEAKLQAAGTVEVRDLTAEIESESISDDRRTDRELAPDEQELVEEISPVIARIFHEGDVQRVETRRHAHSTPGPRVTAG